MNKENRQDKATKAMGKQELTNKVNQLTNQLEVLNKSLIEEYGASYEGYSYSGDVRGKLIKTKEYKEALEVEKTLKRSTLIKKVHTKLKDGHSYSGDTYGKIRPKSKWSNYGWDVEPLSEQDCSELSKEVQYVVDHPCRNQDGSNKSGVERYKNSHYLKELVNKYVLDNKERNKLNKERSKIGVYNLQEVFKQVRAPLDAKRDALNKELNGYKNQLTMLNNLEHKKQAIEQEIEDWKAFSVEAKIKELEAQLEAL